MVDQDAINTHAAHGERYLSIARVCDKLSRKKSWLYDKLKNDPTFPKPIRLGAWQVIPESLIDSWVRGQDQQAPQAAPAMHRIAK